MLSSVECFGLVVYFFVYLTGVYAVYEGYVRKTNQKIGSAIFALTFPVTGLIIEVVCLYRNKRRNLKCN